MPAGYFQNPYANTGRAAGDFINAFVQGDRTQGQGYLQGTQAMADIEGKQITNAAAMDEMSRKRKFDDMDAIQMLKDAGAPDEVIAQIMSGDFSPELAEQLKVASQGAANMRADVAGLNMPFGTQQGATGDIKQAGSIVDVFAKQPPGNMEELRTGIASAKGSYPPKGSSSDYTAMNWSDPNIVAGELGKADVPIFWEAVNANKAANPDKPIEAITKEAMAAVASLKTGLDINELMKVTPLEIVNMIRNPESAGTRAGGSVAEFNEQFMKASQPWRTPAQQQSGKPPGGVNAKWDPINKVWID